jgi:hypothetical protein
VKYSVLWFHVYKISNYSCRLPPSLAGSQHFVADVDRQMLYLGAVPDGSRVILKGTGTCMRGGQTHSQLQPPVTVKSNCADVTRIETAGITTTRVVSPATRNID